MARLPAARRSPFSVGLVSAIAGVLAGRASSTGPGSIRSVDVRPPSCELDPPEFAPDNRFYVVECPESAEVVTLDFDSAFDLAGADGLPVPRPLAVRLVEGEAKLVPVRACAAEAEPGVGGACTTYEFDLHRRGSSQAALSELLIETGSLDLVLSPEFDASVTTYDATVPFGASVAVFAKASKEGFVSFRSFEAAMDNSDERRVTLAPSDDVLPVDVFVVSNDRQGQTRYSVHFKQRPSSDAGLAAIRSNVGHVETIGEQGANEYMLHVPEGSREVAVSATANDRNNAEVRVEDHQGVGYASAVVPLDLDRPFTLVHIFVRAADHSTMAEYMLIVVNRPMEQVAMLSTLDVPACVGGLRPAFQVSVHDYRCVLDQKSEDMKVTPVAMWNPVGQPHMKLSIRGNTWESGTPWTEKLDDNGDAELTVDVESVDGTSSASYTITADGYPVGMRGPLFSTPYPAWVPTSTTTVTTRETTTQTTVTPELEPGKRPVVDDGGVVPPLPQPTSVTTTVTTTVTGRVTFTLTSTSTTTATTTTTTQPPPPARAKVLRLPKSVVEVGKRVLDVAVVTTALTALLASRSVAGGLALLRHVQFVALTMGIVAPSSLYGHLAAPMGVFNLWVRVPRTRMRTPRGRLGSMAFAFAGPRGPRRLLAQRSGGGADLAAEGEDAGDGEEADADDDGQDADGVEHLSEYRRYYADAFAGSVLLFSAILPVVCIAFVIGWISASREERMAKAARMSGAGRWGLRARILPCALVLLDAGVVGCTSSAGIVVLSAAEGVEFGDMLLPRGWVQLLLMAYPIGFSAFSLMQICSLRRQRRLVWSSSLRLFADAYSTAVNLHSAGLKGGAHVAGGSPVLHWLFGEEMHNAVPLQDFEGSLLRLGETPGRSSLAPDACLFGEVPPEGHARIIGAGGSLLPTEAEVGLLPTKARRVAEWQRQEERLWFILWMERRCAIYEALKLQLSEVNHRAQGITDSLGLTIYDSQGKCLTDLYQYCIYQFPWRPWWPRHAWLRTPAATDGDGAATFDPMDRAGGVLAAWVPPAAVITPAERTLMDAWLDRWLVVSEALSKARSSLVQLRWRGWDPRAKGDFLALLQEAALAVLLEQDFKMPNDSSPEDLEEREARLSEIVSERRRRGRPPPWEEDAGLLTEHDVSAALCTDVINSPDFPLTENDLLEPALDRAYFGVKRFYMRTFGELPRVGVAASGTGAARPGDGSSLASVPPAAIARARVTLVACELPVKHLHVLSHWLPPFGFSVAHSSLKLPIRQSWMPLVASCAAPGSPPAAYAVDAIERVVAVAAILAARCFALARKPILSLLSLAMWRGAALALCVWSGQLRHEPWHLSGLVLEVAICACLALSHALATFDLQAEILDRLCVSSVLIAVLSRGWNGLVQMAGGSLLRCGAHPFTVLGINRDHGDAPRPPFGSFAALDSAADGGPLPLLVVVPVLGISLHARACREPRASSDERRAAGCRKRLAVYERPPAQNADDATLGRPLLRPRDLERFRNEIFDQIPMVWTRPQVVGTEEVRELICTIQVINHAGSPWSSVKHDSFLSLYKPNGLDLATAPSATAGGLGDRGGGPASSLRSETERRERCRQTVDSLGLVKSWRNEVVDWLYGELAASGTVEHTAQASLLDAGRADRDAFQTEADRLIAPGIFTDDGIGCYRYTDSRCYREGRVLHYVILASELKSSLTWRPDPLGTHPAELLIGDAWRPCLVRLASRSVSYSLRKRDGVACGGRYPEWQERGRDEGDIVDYTVPFFFLDRIVVDVQQDVVWLHERDRSLPVASEAAVPEYAPRCLPIVFRMEHAMAAVWDQIAKRFRMSTRPEHIVNYVGPVCEHPRLLGISCRQGPEGEQLWDDGSRYVGSWEAHVYHGHGQLLDAAGLQIYKGEWQWGMKHGEGTYYFAQEGTRRMYSGQWACDEFRGHGKLQVLDEDQDELRRTRPQTIVSYEGYFAAAEGQFPKPLNLMKLELDKHASIIKAYFPARPRAQPDNALDGGGARQAPAMQFSGEPPRDYALELYSLDGADLRHCGPSEASTIHYADGTHYEGPCLAGAVPHGLRGVLTEPNGTRYEGGFDHGVRTGPAVLTLANGIRYEGEFAQPGGQRHGEGSTTIPEGHLRSECGFVSYSGQYHKGVRHGQGELMFPDGAVFKGEFRSNRRHGHGRMQDASGAVYDGVWDDDRPAQGPSKILYSSGHRYEGEVVGCQRHGEGTLYYPPSHAMSGGILYKGAWGKDDMHGHGELRAVDGVYCGEFVAGARSGHGRFDYKFPAPGSILPFAAPTKNGAVENSKPRIYTGQWDGDQPHGNGNYTDEYGYTNERALFTHGQISSGRRPPPRGCKEAWFSSQKWPREEQYQPIMCKPTPSGAALPRGLELCRNKGNLSAENAFALRSLDVGSGHAHGRSRPAHLGQEGVPGTRWM